MIPRSKSATNIKKSTSSNSLSSSKKPDSSKTLTKSKSVANLNKDISQVLNDKIKNFKKKESDMTNEVKELVARGYQILKNMNDIDEIKQGYHIKLKLKSTTKKKNNKIIQGGFLLKVVREVIDGKLEFYMQLKSYNRIYRYNLDSVAYIFYKEVTPNAKKIELLEKKIEYMEKKHKLDYLQLIKLVKLSKNK